MLRVLIKWFKIHEQTNSLIKASGSNIICEDPEKILKMILSNYGEVTLDNFFDLKGRSQANALFWFDFESEAICQPFII